VKIKELYAFVVTDRRGVEGVLRRVTPIGTQPMIADCLGRLDAFRADAVAEARAMELPLSVARFVRAEE
jgi:hypothetical protein